MALREAVATFWIGEGGDVFGRMATPTHVATHCRGLIKYMTREISIHTTVLP